VADKHKNPSKEKPDGKSETAEETPKDIKDLFLWKSPARPFKKRNRRFYINLGLMLFIISLIAIFLKEFFALAAIVAIFFYYYIAGTVEPIIIKHRITNRGITTAEHTYGWEDLSDFWFNEKYNDNILQITTKKRLPPRLIMLVHYKDKEKIKKILAEYLIYQDTIPVSWVDKVIERFNAHLPTSMR
jgi:hypothetical protein